MNTLSDLLQSNLVYIKIAIVAAIAAALWWHFKPAPQPVGAPTIATPAPQLALVPHQTITPPKVKVYAPAAKQKLNLPADVQADKNQYVLGAAKIKNDTHPQTVTPVFDQATGETTLYVTRDPYPWLAAEQTGEVRLDYGYKYSHFESLRIMRLTLREDLLQVKALHAGLNASLDSDGQFFIGAGIGYRW